MQGIAGGAAVGEMPVVLRRSVREAYRHLSRWIAVCDALALALALIAADRVRFGVGVPSRDVRGTMTMRGRFRMRSGVSSQLPLTRPRGRKEP